jgi:hypothetical protein
MRTTSKINIKGKEKEFNHEVFFKSPGYEFVRDVKSDNTLYIGDI